MTSLIARIRAFLADDTVRGIAPYVLGIAALVALGWNYGYARTGAIVGTPGLEPHTVYLSRTVDNICAGDAVRYRRPGRLTGSRYGRVEAEAGATVAVEEAGFRVNDIFWALNEILVEASRLSAEKGTEPVREREVPEGHVLVVRRFGETAEGAPAWMFEMMPRENIRSRITHVLFSRDLSRIGEQVAGGDCSA